MQLYLGTYFWEEKLILAKVNIIKDFRTWCLKQNLLWWKLMIGCMFIPYCQYQHHLVLIVLWVCFNKNMCSDTTFRKETKLNWLWSRCNLIMKYVESISLQISGILDNSICSTLGTSPQLLDQGGTAWMQRSCLLATFILICQDIRRQSSCCWHMALSCFLVEVRQTATAGACWGLTLTCVKIHLDMHSKPKNYSHFWSLGVA